MMSYFRQYLIRIRRIENLGYMNPNLSVRFLIAVGTGVFLGILADLLIPYLFFTNMIRGIIANIVGVSAASLIYLKTVELEKANKLSNRYYNPIRKRFSFKQRFNLSLIVGSISTIIFIITNGPGFTYTLFSSIYITIILVLIGFSRRSRDEFIKDSYEIPDIRDLDFMSKDNEEEVSLEEKAIEAKKAKNNEIKKDKD